MSETTNPEVEKAPEVPAADTTSDTVTSPNADSVPLGEVATPAPTPTDATSVKTASAVLPAATEPEKTEEPAFYSAPVVDWEKALEQVGGDTSFLFEVISDFFDEAQPALDDLSEGIAAANFEKIMHSSHKIKGSASFVYCEHIKLKAAELQMLGRKGTETSEGSAERLETVKKDAELLHQIFANTKAEIQKYKLANA